MARYGGVDAGGEVVGADELRVVEGCVVGC